MTAGTCYVWRVWPYTGTRFTRSPRHQQLLRRQGVGAEEEGGAGGRAAQGRGAPGQPADPAPAARARPFSRLAGVPTTISFARGASCPEALASDLIAECARLAPRRTACGCSYGTGHGYPPCARCSPPSTGRRRTRSSSRTGRCRRSSSSWRPCSSPATSWPSRRPPTTAPSCSCACTGWRCVRPRRGRRHGRRRPP